MLAYMNRTTVKLPEDLDARLRHEAERRGTTISVITREAIEAHLGGRVGRRRLRAAGAGASGHSDISERIEEILSEEFGSSL
jgi:predicted transcriptional regulator